MNFNTKDQFVKWLEEAISSRTNEWISPSQIGNIARNIIYRLSLPEKG